MIQVTNESVQAFSSAELPGLSAARSGALRPQPAKVPDEIINATLVPAASERRVAHLARFSAVRRGFSHKLTFLQFIERILLLLCGR